MITDWATDYTNIMILREAAFMVENDTKGVGRFWEQECLFLGEGITVIYVNGVGRVAGRAARILPSECIGSPRGNSVQ
jgi:hypothetical protein